jgi:hypothetical protein
MNRKKYLKLTEIKPVYQIGDEIDFDGKKWLVDSVNYIWNDGYEYGIVYFTRGESHNLFKSVMEVEII